MAAPAAPTSLPAFKTSKKKRKHFKPVAPELLGFRSAGTEEPKFAMTSVLTAVCEIVATVVAKEQAAHKSPDIESTWSVDIETQEVFQHAAYLRHNLGLLNAAFDMLCLEQVLTTGDRRGHRQRWCWTVLQDPRTILFNYEQRLNNEVQIANPLARRWR